MCKKCSSDRSNINVCNKGINTLTFLLVFELNLIFFPFFYYFIHYTKKFTNSQVTLYTGFLT